MNYGIGNEQVVGACSCCGGPVTLPLAWWSIIPPVPTCQHCGATKREHGPVIDMQPPPKVTLGKST